MNHESIYTPSRIYLDLNGYVIVEGNASICIDECGEPPKSMHIDDLIAHLETGIYEKKKYDLLMWAELQEQCLNALVALKKGVEAPKFSLAKSMALISALQQRRARD